MWYGRINSSRLHDFGIILLSLVLSLSIILLLKMKDLPGETTKKGIKEFFENEFEERGTRLKTTEINLVYDLTERISKLD